MINFRTLSGQYINGEWRDGNSSLVMENKNPYNGEILATYRAANMDDLNAAYISAQTAQKQWEKTNPVVKRGVFERAVAYIEENHEAIVDIIIDEIGGTRLKAEFEIDLVKNMIKEAFIFRCV